MCIHQATTRRPSGKLTITSDRRLQKGYQGIQEESSRLLGKKERKKEECIQQYIIVETTSLASQSDIIEIIGRERSDIREIGSFFFVCLLVRKRVLY